MNETVVTGCIQNLVTSGVRFCSKLSIDFRVPPGTIGDGSNKRERNQVIAMVYLQERALACGVDQASCFWLVSFTSHSRIKWGLLFLPSRSQCSSSERSKKSD